MELLNKRKFLPLFLTQFLGAFNDNLLRNGLIVLITFKIAASDLPADPKILTAIASALLVAPYIFFSSLAGELADKYERSRLMLYTKLFEVCIMLVATYGFLTNNILLLIGLVFASGTQSTFFSPMKYSLLPTHLKKSELIKGNGLIEGGTFLAILTGCLSGTALGSLIDIHSASTTYYIISALLAIAMCGIISCLYIPIAPAAAPELKVSANLFKSTIAIMRVIKRDKIIFRAIIFTSWFWMCGSIYLSLFPGYVKEILKADSDLYAVYLAAFSIGVAIGSVACGKILKNQITPRLTHITLIGSSLATFVMVGLSIFAAKSGITTGVADYFGSWFGVPLFISMMAIAFCWGVYSVPLKAIIQTRAKDSERSRVIAGENIINACFMVGAGGLITLLLSFEVNILAIWTFIAIINLFMAIIAYKLWR